MKTPVWVVTNVQPQKDYTLILTFASGETKLFEAFISIKYTDNNQILLIL